MQARGLDDDVDGGGDLFAQGGKGNFNAAEQRAGFHTEQTVTGAVGVDGGHAALVTGVHGLQQIQRLAAANFADDDAVRSETQRGMKQIADGDFALAVFISLPGFKANLVGLL